MAVKRLRELTKENNMDNSELRKIIFGTLCDNQHPKGKGILVKHFVGISCLLANKISEWSNSKDARSVEW